MRVEHVFDEEVGLPLDLNPRDQKRRTPVLEHFLESSVHLRLNVSYDEIIFSRTKVSVKKLGSRLVPIRAIKNKGCHFLNISCARGLGFGVWGLEFRVWELVFGVWGLVVVVWGLRSGVWGLIRVSGSRI